MAGQERKTVGERIAERLTRRVQRRARLGLSATLLARFGVPEGDLSFGGEGQVDGDMVFLSIQPYLARMRRLAWSRRRRELRLSRLAERYGARVEAPAWRRWPGATKTVTAGASWLGGGLDILGTSEMHLPPAPARAASAEPAQEVAAPPRRRSGWTGAFVSDSPWLITPFIPARVVRGQARQPASQAPVVLVQAAPGSGLPQGGRSAERAERAITRAGSRAAQAVPAASPLVRAVQDASPALSRTASGRRLARQLIEIASLPVEEQVVQVRRVLRQAGAARRVVVETVEQALPSLVERPLRRAVERSAAASGQGRSRGLRPVSASSPSMQAVRSDRPVASQDLEPVGPAPRPTQSAARRAAGRDLGGALSAPPVARHVARAARALSASPMGQGRSRAPASSRRSTSTAARVAQARVAVASAPSSTAGPTRSAGTSSTRPSRSAARRAARAADDGGPGSEPPGLDPAADEAAVVELRRPRASARAAQRLEMFQAQAAEPVAPELSPRAQRPARFQVTRSPQGAYVPAITLARAAAAPAAPVEPTVVVAPVSRAPSRKGVSASTVPARRAPGGQVVGVPSTARVAGPRALSSAHASERGQVQAPRPGSSLARVVAPQHVAPQHEASAAPLSPRRLSAVRDARGTFVSSTAPSRELPGSDLPAALDATTRGTLRSRAPSEGVLASTTRGDRAPSPALASAPADWAARRLDAAQAQPTASSRQTRLLAPVVSALAAPRSRAVAVDAPSGPPATPATARASRAVAPVLAAAARADRPAAVAQSVRRTVSADARSSSSGQAPSGGAPSRTVYTRSRPNPAAYVARYGLSSVQQVVVQVVDAPASTSGDPASRADAPGGRVASPLDRLDLRALSLGDWGRPDRSLPREPSAAAQPVTRRARSGGAARTQALAAPGVVLRPAAPSSAAPAADPAVAPAPVGRAPRGASATTWAQARSGGASTERALRSPQPRERGGFDLLGTYRAPLAAERRGGPRATATGAATSSGAYAAPDRSLVRPERGSSAPAASPFAMPGAAPAARDRRVRPDLGVTLGAVDQGVADRALPTWAFRATGEPLIRAEGQFIDALTRATEPEEILRVIYQRAARGNLTSASTGLPAPVIQVIEQIRAVAGQVDLAAAAVAGSGGKRGGPASDAEVLRRSGVSRQAPRSTARVASGMTSLRSRGSASRRDGVGADGISKLSKKLQQLILLAERQRQAARQQVRMAEDSAAARAEGHSSPGSGEGGIDKKIDIEALGREVLEVVSQELEMRKARSQEGSDEYGWW